MIAERKKVQISKSEKYIENKKKTNNNNNNDKEVRKDIKNEIDIDSDNFCFIPKIYHILAVDNLSKR